MYVYIGFQYTIQKARKLLLMMVLLSWRVCTRAMRTMRLKQVYLIYTFPGFVQGLLGYVHMYVVYYVKSKQTNKDATSVIARSKVFSLLKYDRF